MNEIVGRYTNVNGVQAYYESTGSGVPIVLLHTAGREGRQWHGLMRCLSSHYQLIAPDLPGHGKSFALAGNRCLDEIHDIAAWVWSFIESLALDRPVIMGCSVGGNLTLLLAALHPEIRAAIALQGAAYTPTFTDTALAMMTHPQVSLMHANMDFSMSLVGSAASDEARTLSAWGVLSIIPVAQQADLTAYARCDTREWLEKVRCPVLIARGTDDWLVSQAMVEDARAHLTHAKTVELRQLPGLGHFPHLEDPARVAEMTSAFLQQI
jgi:pimeloyl-ACP methyl ester carboxylesterase